MLLSWPHPLKRLGGKRQRVNEPDPLPGIWYAWKSKFGGMEAFDVRRMRDLEYEDARLKQIYAGPSMENQAETLRRKLAKLG